VKWFRYHSTFAAETGHRLTAHSVRISVESVCVALLLSCGTVAKASTPPAKGVASWYGEDHRGRLMANGKKFDPDKFTAASWFYPLGTKVRVTARSKASSQPLRSVLVTITDRGPADELVRGGRIIDLSAAPFKRLASPDLGLVSVSVQPVRSTRKVRS
jgi:rare lipoprotein A